MSALSLGDMQTQSYLGQRFKGSVSYQLSPTETSLADCITISPVSGEMPYIGRSEIEIRPIGDGNSGTILIRSNQSIAEPMVALNLSIQCGVQQLSREFTIFLDPAPVSELAVASNTRPIEVLKARPEVKQPTAKRDTTLADVAARYYPVDTPQYLKYLSRLKKANPDVATTETLISAGSPLFVPPRPKIPPPKIVPDALPKETGQLRLEDADAINKPASEPINAKQNTEAYAKALEEKIVTLTELKKRLQLELADLDLKMAQIQLASANAKSANAVVASGSPVVSMPTQVASSAMAAPQATAVAISQATPIPAVTRTESKTNWNWAWLALAGGGVGGFMWWRRRLQAQAERWANEDINAVDLNRSIMSIIQAKMGHTMAHSPNTAMSLFGANQKNSTGFEVKEELNDNLDQAQYFLAQGETLKAIDLLYAAIDEVPEDTERWLMLFRVFRQQIMKTEYSALAYRFKAMHKDEGDWELIRSIGNKLDPENPLFIRHVEEAKAKTATPFDSFDSGMAAAAPATPVVLEIVPDFTDAPVLPDFETGTVTTSEAKVDEELMTFLVKDSEPEEPPPLLPDVEKHRHL
ncbi:MAG: type IV pilus assembly protein FimV [Deefgea sp.]